VDKDGEETGDFRLAHGLSADEYMASVVPDQLADRLPGSQPFGHRAGDNEYLVASIEGGFLSPLVLKIDSSPNLLLQTVGHTRG
jgi:hypothetical protein